MYTAWWLARANSTPRCWCWKSIPRWPGHVDARNGPGSVEQSRAVGRVCCAGWGKVCLGWSLHRRGDQRAGDGAGTNIGAAHPIQSGGQDIPGDLREKITNDAAAYIGSIARQRGRNDQWVRDAVRQSVSIGADEAADQHVADLVAPDLRTLLATVDDRSVTTGSGPTTISVVQADITPLDPTLIELIADKVFDPTIAYLLMTIGFFAILTELFHPGALVPGVSGVVCLVLAFVGFASLPMNWGGVVLIVAAAALFILDIKPAAHGGLTIAGLVCFAIGSLLLYSPPPGGLPSPTLPDVSVALPALVGAAGVGAAFSLLVVRTAMRMAERASITGAQRLSGATGIARTSMDLDGTVTIRGQSGPRGFAAVASTRARLYA